MSKTTKVIRDELRNVRAKTRELRQELKAQEKVETTLEKTLEALENAGQYKSKSKGSRGADLGPRVSVDKRMEAIVEWMKKELNNGQQHTTMREFEKIHPGIAHSSIEKAIKHGIEKNLIWLSPDSNDVRYFKDRSIGLTQQGFKLRV